MSIPVELTELADEIAKHSFGYLLTVSDDGRPHAVAVNPTWHGALLLVEVGRRTAANAAARAEVALVFPPVEPGGYSLIVDATATPADAGAENGVTLLPRKAVLHRPAPTGSPSAAEGCGADCVPLPIDHSSAVYAARSRDAGPSSAAAEGTPPG